MNYEKTILCLANSRKTSGRCIAGIEQSDTGGGGWVRPVSSRDTQEISKAECRYENGKTAQILDVITIPMIKPVPYLHQAENHLIDDEYYWERQGRGTFQDVEELVQPMVGPLWINGKSTYHGMNDKVPEAELGTLGDSLQLIRPESVRLEVQAESGFNGRPGKRSVRARFESAGSKYLLKVTDPLVEDEYLVKANGAYELENAILCVSLSEPFHDFAFKLVAAILTPENTV